MRFSPSTKAFYPESIHYPNLPSDVVTVSDADFKVAQAARTAGHEIEFLGGKLAIKVKEGKTLQKAKEQKKAEIAARKHQAAFELAVKSFASQLAQKEKQIEDAIDKLKTPEEVEAYLVDFGAA